jgi:hypothetical protein
MIIGELLIWYWLTLVWLLVAALGIVRFRRALRDHPAFTDKDWQIVFGLPRDRVMTGALWLRFALANLVVMAVGFGIVLLLLPHGVGWVIAAVAFTALAVIILLPKLLRSTGDNP